MNRNGIDDFLQGIEEEHRWTVLLLQEFDGSAQGESYVSASGHAVFVVPPCLGCRSAGIVVHKDITHCILDQSFSSTPRLGSLLLHWEGHDIHTITAHLPPRNHSTKDYCGKLDELEGMMDQGIIHNKFIQLGKMNATLNSQKHFTILGIDAQVGI